MTKVFKTVCLISALALILALGAVALLPVSVTRAAETLYESYTTGDDTDYTCWGSTWLAQTFTPTSNHNITRAEMLMVRDATYTGTVTVSIRNTDGSGHPTGSDLTSISFNASTVPTTAGYVSATFSTPISVTSATKYALVVRSVRTSGAGTQVWWRADTSSPTYSLGNMESSSDSGSSWTSASFNDLLFRIYGDPDIVLIDADFSGTPTSGPAPLTVQFTDETTGGTVTSWSWDFDNDTVEDSDEENPEYIYTVPGTYTVSLTVNGGEDTETKSGYIDVEASATTVWVDDDWAGLDPGDDADGHIFGHDAFASIQDGIDNVVDSTVNVLPGTYDTEIETFPLTIENKSLTVQATGDAEETIIDAEGTGQVFYIDINGDAVTISGFTITGGSEPTTGIHASYVENGSSLTVEDCIITENNGDGIYVNSITDGSVTITDNSITDNNGDGIGIGYVGTEEGNSEVTISNNDILGNGWEGIYMADADDGTITIEGNTITDNGAIEADTGIYIEYLYGDAMVNITGNTITENYGGGIGFEEVYEDAEVTIDDNDISDNLYAYIYYAGEGIWVDDIYDNALMTIEDNTITGNYDEGILLYWVYGDAAVTIEDNVITDNGDDGIDIEYVDGIASGSVDIAYNTISENDGDGVDINYQDHDYQVTVSPCNDIYDNGGHGVNNGGYAVELLRANDVMAKAVMGEPKMVDATENWWGDPSGPSGEGPGSGDSVTSAVKYDPWLTAPCGEGELQAVASASALTGTAPFQVQFYDLSTGDIATWYWSFGDGSYSDVQYPTHTYQDGGAYQVCLTIETEDGRQDTACLKIIVEEGATAPELVVRNLYISATQAQPGQQVMITADVFNEGGAWGSGEMQLLINGYYEQSVQVGVSSGTSQPISFTVYKVTPGQYQVVIGNATGTFYVVEEAQQSQQVGGIPMDSGTLIALIVIGVFVIAALVVAIVVLKPS